MAFSSRCGIAITSITCRSRRRESLGVEARAAFYESAGALRDMVQSHMLQLTSLVSMEAPAKFDATAVRNEKIKVLQSIRPFTPETVWKSVVRGAIRTGNDRRQAGAGLPPGKRREARFAAPKLTWR